MWPNPQETKNLVTFTEEICNENLHFLCGDIKELEISISHLSMPGIVVIKGVKYYILKSFRFNSCDA